MEHQREEDVVPGADRPQYAAGASGRTQRGFARSSLPDRHSVTGRVLRLRPLKSILVILDLLHVLTTEC